MSREDTFVLWLASLGLHNPWKILDDFGSPEAVFCNATEPKIASCANAGYLTELVSRTEAALAGSARFVPYTHADYPARLAGLPGAPLGIFCAGALPAPKAPSVAIIGARGNTHYGRDVTKWLAGELAAAGVVVISGLARGLDAVAHKAALAAGGHTCAVLPCGIDMRYPAENERLYDEIAAAGCLVTEYFPGFLPQKWTFGARNRIIAGMADVIAVTEAGIKSGTQITVEHGLNYGKEIFAVPGRIFDKKSGGTNELIKQGAHILTCPEDVLLALKISHSPPKEAAEKKIPLASDEALVYACIDYDPVTVDYIVYKTGLNVADVNRILLNMELSQHVKRLPGQKYIKN